MALHGYRQSDSERDRDNLFKLKPSCNGRFFLSERTEIGYSLNA